MNQKQRARILRVATTLEKVAEEGYRSPNTDVISDKLWQDWLDGGRYYDTADKKIQRFMKSRGWTDEMLEVIDVGGRLSQAVEEQLKLAKQGKPANKGKYFVTQKNIKLFNEQHNIS